MMPTPVGRRQRSVGAPGSAAKRRIIKDQAWNTATSASAIVFLWRAAAALVACAASVRQRCACACFAISTAGGRPVTVTPDDSQAPGSRHAAVSFASVTGAADARVTWKVRRAQGCRGVDSSGLYTAPGLAAPIMWFVTSVADGFQEARERQSTCRRPAGRPSPCR